MPADRALVIGYGNPLRGDDAAGPEAARRLGDLGFRALAVHQLTPELAEPIAFARAVVFLDADARVPAGQIAITPLAPAPPSAPLEHHASPAALLRLARDVYGAAPDACLISLGAAAFEFGARLSAAAEQAVSHAIREVFAFYGAAPCA